MSRGVETLDRLLINLRPRICEPNALASGRYGPRKRTEARGLRQRLIHQQAVDEFRYVIMADAISPAIVWPLHDLLQQECLLNSSWSLKQVQELLGWGSTCDRNGAAIGGFGFVNIALLLSDTFFDFFRFADRLSGSLLLFCERINGLDKLRDRNRLLECGTRLPFTPRFGVFGRGAAGSGATGSGATGRRWCVWLRFWTSTATALLLFRSPTFRGSFQEVFEIACHGMSFLRSWGADEYDVD